MPQIIDSDKMVVLNHIRYLVGSIDVIKEMINTPALPPFDDTVLSFVSDLSKEFIKLREYSDVVTFGFWIRQASLNKLKERFSQNTEGYRGYRGYRLGQGLVFHIAPSNVPVNFAYSLVSSLLMGNSNIVRVPSKDFPQVRIITKAINTVITAHPAMKERIACVQYDHQNQQAAKAINDLFSSICDVRIIWGGNKTIETLRQSSLQPRSTEITFADRFSIAVIDSDSYLDIEDKARTAQDFYNDTFFSDQNACTSPRIIFWVGTEEKIAEAKSLFWQLEHDFVKTKYNFQPIMGVNKLTRAYIDAAKGTYQEIAQKTYQGAHQEHISFKIEPREDNLIVRVAVQNTDMLSTLNRLNTVNALSALNTVNTFQNLDNNSGFFYECNLDREHFSEGIKAVCNDKRCQTVAYIGNKKMFTELLRSGIKGIDRIVPIGKTMDFDLIWDGYNLPEYLSRIISIS